MSVQRYFLTPLLFSFLLLSCNGTDPEEQVEPRENEGANYCDCKELAFDQAYNNFYLETPRDGFTGLCENFYANGQVSLSKNFKEGKVDGEMIEFFEDGSVKEKKAFDKNFQTGDHFLYDEAGELIFHVVYEYGKQIQTIYVRE